MKADKMRISDGSSDVCSSDLAGGVLQRRAQAARRLQVERQRDGAELEIEIDQRRLVLALLGQDPSEIDREGAGADAAARADHSNPRLLLGRGLDDIYLLQLLGAIEGRDQGFLGDWLHEVVAGAGIDDSSEERRVGKEWGNSC